MPTRDRCATSRTYRSLGGFQDSSVCVCVCAESTNGGRRQVTLIHTVTHTHTVFIPLTMTETLNDVQPYAERKEHPYELP